MRASSRRAALLAAGVVSTILLAAAPAGAAAAAPWREGDYGAARNAYNANETLVNAGSLAHLSYVRSVTAPPGDPNSPECGAGVATKPVVVDHRLFVVLTGRLVSVDLVTGHTLWSVPLDTALTTIYANLAVVANKVVVSRLDCISQSDPSGSITAFDVNTGAQVWNSFMDPGPQAMNVWQNQVLYTGFEAGGGGDLVSLDLATGAVQWQYAPGLCDGMGRPVVVGGVILVQGCDASNNAVLEGHALATGAIVWTRLGEYDVQRGTSAGAAGHDAYVWNEVSGALTDVNPATGAIRWARTGRGSALAVDNLHVYTDCAVQMLCALKPSTGAVQWEVFESGISDDSTVAVAGGAVFPGTAFGTVVKASDGSAVPDRFGEPLAIWDTAVDALAVSGGRVVVAAGRVIDVYKVPGA